MVKFGAILLCLISLLFAGVVTSSAETSATVTVEPSSYEGKCPVTVMVNGKITSTSAGDVTIKYVF
jgi:hypothetical protein